MKKRLKTMTNGNGNGVAIWIGLGVGASVGLAFALKQRKKDPWSNARVVSRRVAEGTGGLAATTKDIAQRIGIIYEESRKVAEDLSELWSHGRKLIGV
jgi:LPXTG-motif cell wall-anchored protein